ncbi:fasciclin domain-containing protein [Thiorhodococcus minor]|uniref:Fasciclin domain-containing protein n=1 Tax=Thiorhodococcus minor TaxID=57489 RepID=A0A6M0K6M9_9GAMM|nr:fasciclin domain-containing protein [Thiorhodococcus minor]NEV65109.1 fasciclin domain-containing protein [Thiorhodococcus minor]
MAKDTVNTFNPLTTVLMLGAALGPLAALSLGSKYADEETLERARAGLVNAKPSDLYAHYDSTRDPSAVADKTIAEITAGAGIFRELQAAIKAAGAEAMLSGQTPITVLAPSSEAFAKLAPEQKAALMRDKEASSQFVASHIVPGVVSTTELMQKQSISTLSGQSLPVSMPGQLQIGDAKVAKTIAAENGIVHVIDSVLL